MDIRIFNDKTIKPIWKLILRLPLFLMIANLFFIPMLKNLPYYALYIWFGITVLLTIVIFTIYWLYNNRREKLMR